VSSAQECRREERGEGKNCTFIIGALQVTIILVSSLSIHSPLLHSLRLHSPEMHSLNPNRTIPQPPHPTLAPRRRSSTLPSPTLLLEPSSRRPERLRLALCSEELCAKRWPGGAEECAGCGHGDSSAEQSSSILEDQSNDVLFARLRVETRGVEGGGCALEWFRSGEVRSLGK
jgi:hypothetical protein